MYSKFGIETAAAHSGRIIFRAKYYHAYLFQIRPEELATAKQRSATHSILLNQF